MKVILAFVLAITLVVPINNSASGKEASPESNTTLQCQLVQQAFMIELHPKIMSVLRERYQTDFLFIDARVIPITVQLTFQADRTNGYRADDLNVVSTQPRKGRLVEDQSR